MTASFGSGFPVGVSLIFFIYFVLPGISFVKAVELGERDIEDLSRLDKLGYVMAGGTASMFVILVVDFLISLFNSNPPLSPSAIMASSAILVVGGVVLQSTIAAIGGYWFGKFLNHRRNPKNTRTWEDREQPWKYISDKIRQEQVTIITKDGSKLKGVVSRYGSGRDSGDLTLGSPRFITRYNGEEYETQRYGNEAFISRDDIAQIHYEDKEYFVDDDVEASEKESDEEPDKDSDEDS